MCKGIYSKTCKKDKTKIFMTNGSLMKVEIIVECSFCNTFDLHLAIIVLKTKLWSFLEWLFYTGFSHFLIKKNPD